MTDTIETTATEITRTAKSESGIGVNPEHRSCLEIAAAIRSRETDNASPDL